MSHFAPDLVLASSRCPTFGSLELTRPAFHVFQLELRQVLNKIICSAGHELSKKLTSCVEESLRGAVSSKLTSAVDAFYPCASIDHKHCAERKKKSKKLCVASVRALHRLVNDEFVGEVKYLFENALCCQMVHAWSWMGKGRNGNLCLDNGRKSDFGGSSLTPPCYMKHVATNLCCHGAFPEIWPAVVLKKAIDSMPRLMNKLELDAMKFVSRCVKRT